MLREPFNYNSPVEALDILLLTDSSKNRCASIDEPSFQQQTHHLIWPPELVALNKYYEEET